MLPTRTFVPGDPAASVARAPWNWVRNVATGVIAASVEVQMSFPPISIVRYSGWSATSPAIWPLMSTIRAPLTERLKF